MKLWLDDIRRPISEYHWCHSVNEAIQCILEAEKNNEPIEVIDCDHDMGDYYYDGGDGIKLLDWLVETGRNHYPIELHTRNIVGEQNMRRVIERYWNN